MQDEFIKKKKERVYTDGSCKKRRATFRVWKEIEKEREITYKVLRVQNAYNRELQGMIYSVNEAKSNTKRDVLVDNSVVLFIANKIKKGEYIQWNKLPEPELKRILKEKIEWKRVIENIEFNFIKVKKHSKIKENEETDRLAKERVEKEEIYIKNKDLDSYRNEVSLQIEEKEIKERYRKKLKEILKKQNKIKAKKDNNEQ